MEKPRNGPPLQQYDALCSSLIDELQTIWNDIGESDAEKDEMLLELQKECLELHRRKVVQTNLHRAQLRQSITDSEAEIAAICSALGERSTHLRQNDRSLKEELKAITLQLDKMRERRDERLSQFLQVREQIRLLLSEIRAEDRPSEMPGEESDLSQGKLEDLHRRLDSLRKEKNELLSKAVDCKNALNSLCAVLDMDFRQTVVEIHPSLDGPDESINVSWDAVEKLTQIIQRLREVKLQRMHKLQDLAMAMLEMWLLMDTPVEEQQQFHNVTCNIAASEDEITEPKSLSMRFINHVEEEVTRLEEVKVRRMKELILKKNAELDDLCRRTHLVAKIDIFSDAETLDPSLLLEQIEAQISILKEEAFDRKEIVERVEKWLAACEEESWLEEYNRDENRYNAGKGTHLVLKRAERARAVVNKIPGLVETLTSKIIPWESDRGTPFIYDGSSLLSMLEEYTLQRREKENERKRQRDQRRLQGQMSPHSLPGKMSNGGAATAKRLSIGGKLDTLPSCKCPSSAKKSDAHAGGLFSSRECDIAPQEEGTPRKPFTPLGQPLVPAGSPDSGLKSPRADCCAQDTAARVEMIPEGAEVSFEERRLELFLMMAS